MAADGRVIIEAEVDSSRVKSGAKQIEKSLGGAKKAATALGKALVVAMAVKKVIDFGLACAELGSALEEVENVTSTVFPHMTEQLNAFTKAAVESAGLSETMAKRYIGTFGAMASSFGFSEEQAYGMSEALTQMVGDVASFYNISQDEAFNKLKGVFTGETEALKSLGIVMTQTALDEYALANGFGKTTAQMSEGEKVALRYSFVMSRLSNASGDFVRTADSWANQMRLFNLYIEQIKTNIGTSIINLFKPVLQGLNRVLQAVNVVTQAFVKFTELITGKEANTGGGAVIDTDIGDTFSEAADSANDYADATDKAAEATKNAANAAKAYESPLDNINKYQEQAASSTTAANKNQGNNTTPGIGGINLGGLPAAGEAIDEIGSKVEAFYGKVKTMLEPTIESFEKLKEALAPIGEKILDGWKWIFDNVLAPLAEWSITEELPQFFNTLSSVLRILNTVLDVLKPIWQWFWDSVLSPIVEWSADTFIQAWAWINEKLSDFADWYDTYMDNAVGFFGDVYDKIKPIVTNIASWISEKWEGVSSTVSTIFGNIKSYVVDNIKTAYDTMAPIVKNIADKLSTGFDSAKTAVSTVFNGIKTTFDNIFGSIGSIVKATVDNIASKLSDGLSSAVSTFSTVVNGVKTAVNNVFSSSIYNTVKTSIENVANKISTGLNSAKTAFANIMSDIGKAANNVFGTSGAIGKTMKNMLDTIASKIDSVKTKAYAAFYSIWDTAWQQIKKPINGIIGFLNALVRGTVNGMNKMLGVLNKIKVSIPRWVPVYGGKTIGFNFRTISLPASIPYLAKGAVIPPNAPFTAVLGDQRSGKNLEAPESLIRQIVSEESGKGEYRFTAQINRRVLFDEVISEAKLRKNATGFNPFALA